MMDTYQIIATGGMVIGAIVTMAKAWVAANTRQKEHAKLIADLTKRIEQMQSACLATHKEVDTDRIRFGAMISKIETLLDERTERRTAP